MKRILFFVLFLVFISSIAYAQTPTLQKYVNDYANVLSSADEARLNALAAEIEQNTTVEIAILTVNTTGDMSIEEYAVETFENNGIGKKDVDNGILIMAAIDDRKWRIEVGYGLEGVLNDAKAGLIGRTYMTPAFQEERYGDGFYDAVSAIYVVLQNGGDTSFISEQVNADEFIPFFIIFFVIFIPLIVSLASMASTPKCPKCGGRMKCKIKGDYVICECTKCKYKTKKKRDKVPWWLLFFVGSGRSGHGGSFGGGGGGFGGGGSGGGGASGGW